MGYTSKEQLAVACAARTCFDEYIHILFILGPVGAISQGGCLALIMGNDIELITVFQGEATTGKQFHLLLCRNLHILPGHIPR